MAALKWTIMIASIAGAYYWLTGESEFDAAAMRGKRVLITGASTGIGEQLAYAYSRLGARVMLTARRQTLLAGVGRRCEALGAMQVLIVAADMSLAADRERVMAAADHSFNATLDHLILNHALVRYGRWTASTLNVTSLRTAFEVNFMSYVEMASLAVDRLMLAGGRIGVISSVSGRIPVAGYSYYSSTKFALDAFFSIWRQELEMSRSLVSVTNCILGLIDTETAMDSIRRGEVKVDGRMAASAEECAAVVLRALSLGHREVFFPSSAKFITLLHRYFPGLVQHTLAQFTL